MKLTPEVVQFLRAHPDRFALDILGEQCVEDYQRRVMRAIADFDRVAVRATHAVGKTWMMARIALGFMSLYPGARVITTAPTHRQVELLLWGEMNTAHSKSKIPLGGKMLGTKWTISKDWWAIGFSPKKEREGGGDEQKGSTFQGFHSRYVLIIFDEATGVPRDVWTMAEGLVTSGIVVKWVAVGNPTARRCQFFKCFSDPTWHKIKISCFDSPNLIANGLRTMSDLENEIDLLRGMDEERRLERIRSYKIVNPYLLRADWVVGFVYKLGFTHPLVVSKCFGEFPEENDNALVSLAMVERSIERNHEADMTGLRFIGIDCARFGADYSKVTEIVGLRTTRKLSLSKFDTSEVAGAASNFLWQKNNDRRTIVLIDVGGLGAGVVDRMREYVREKRVDWEIVELNFGAKALDPDHYFNAKSEMFSKLAEDIKAGLGLPDEDVYREELPEILHHFNGKGQLCVESKEDFKRRTGRNSPDDSDSLALANYCRYHSANNATSFPALDDMKRKKMRVVEY